MQSDTAMRNKNGGLNLQAVPMHPQPASYSKFIAGYSKLSPGGPIPHNLARALMPRQPYSVAVPSTGGRFSSSSLRFLSPANGGTEGGVKTIEEDRDERWSLP